MALVDLYLPKMGESVTEAKILRWLKKPGEKIENDESLLEVATDKVDTEVPAAHGGILKQTLAAEGDTIQIGQVIAILESEDSTVATPTASMPSILPQVTPPIGSAQTSTIKPLSIAAVSNHKFYSPLVRTIARQEHILQAELDGLQGSGAAGRVTKEDLLQYVAQRKSQQTLPKQATPSAPAVMGRGDEIVEMDRMRQMISERMVENKRIAPHVTSFVEADLTILVQWRKQMKSNFQQITGETLTYTPLFIEAIAKVIADFPMINVQVDGNKIIKKKDINIGMAVALPNGNLIVPVIRNADKLSLIDLTKKVNDLVHRARTSKLKPDDLSGGTYTVSNIGTFGNLMGTPIIMQPQVAIMALGVIQKKPVVVELSDGNDAIAIRHRMILSHAYDHRVVDGALGGMVVRRVADYLENFDSNRLI